MLADLVCVKDLAEAPQALIPEQALWDDGLRPRCEVVPGKGVLAVGVHLRPVHLAQGQARRQESPSGTGRAGGAPSSKAPRSVYNRVR